MKIFFKYLNFMGYFKFLVNTKNKNENKYLLVLKNNENIFFE